MKLAKSILAAVLLVASSVTMANGGPNHNNHGANKPRVIHNHVHRGHWHHRSPHHGHWHRHHSGHWYWVPALIGGVIIGNAVARDNPVIVEREEAVRDQIKDTDKTMCTEWREVQTSEGRVYRERTCRREE